MYDDYGCSRRIRETGAVVTPQTTHPQTYAAFAAMDALDHLERIARLDAAWASIRAGDALAAGPPLQTSGSDVGAPNYDLIYAGGGLGLIHAAVMAKVYRRRVLLFDRGEVGSAHREWNISRDELAALVEVGFCSWDDLAPVIMREYADGIVRFANAAGDPAVLHLPRVLNVALDAGGLLRLARRVLEDHGGVVLDRRQFCGVRVHPTLPRVAVTCADAQGRHETHHAALLLDAMGSTSPLALQRFAGQRPFAGVCPTVGTVAAGFASGDAPDEHSATLGDILVTVDGAQGSRQYMWEGFPGRDDDLTVYLFYYEALGRRAPGDAPGLLDLFEDYFVQLPGYKRPGPHFRHQKPVYGYIPARHALNGATPLLRGVLPVGDAAAQQSPLTFCGFGSHVRNLDRTTTLLHDALRDDQTAPHQLAHVGAYQSNVALNWVFSRFMEPWQRGDDVNRLQHDFLCVLERLGEPLATRYFRDQMRWSDYHRMVLGMFAQRPTIVFDAWQVLGPRGIVRWVRDYLRYSATAGAAHVAARIGERGRAGFLAAAQRLAPAMTPRLRALVAEWRVMGWLTPYR